MNSNSRVVIVGSGGHAQVVASTVIANGHQIMGFYDDDEQKWGKRIFDIPVIGSIDQLMSSNDFDYGIIGIGDNELRKHIASKLDLDWITVVHPFSWIHPDVTLGVGTVICAGAIVQPGADIGSHVIINTKSSVDHHCKVGDYAHLAASHLAGGASVEEGVFMALSSTVLPGIKVGSWATVGAGAVVTKDVLSNTIVAGSPARRIKSKLANSNVS
ncbi:MAG: acetyltransferase [Cyanobacteria bacterium P01_E01_bin.35]